MRIGIMLQSFNESIGGIGIYTQEIVRSLLQIDGTNEYFLMYPGYGTARAQRGQFRQHKNAIEVETEFFAAPLRPYWRQAAALAPRLTRKMRNLAPIDVHWDQVVVPRMAKRYGIDVVFNPHLSVPIRGRFGKVMVLHNVEYHTVPNVYTWRINLWWNMVEKVILPAADRMISLSQAMTADVHKYVNYPIAHVRTIYHGVTEKFRVETDCERLAHARAKYHLPERFVLFVGRLYPQKNFATLARAFALVKDTIPHRLVVVGQPRYKFEGDLNLLGELGIADRVDFLHYVPNDDLPAIYNLADCFVYPSLYESFGLAQLEAMRCGCPVIGANAGAIPEVTGGAAILFDPHNPQELSEAILKVTCQPGVRRDLVERGLARAREFTWERTARETLAVFKELA
jgi:glycosyltransferase involved in cell wall biosynthesis